MFTTLECWTESLNCPRAQACEEHRFMRTTVSWGPQPEEGEPPHVMLRCGWCGGERYRQTRQQEGRRPRRTDTSYGRRPQMVQGSWDIWLFELENNETDKPGTGRGESHAGLTHPVDAGHRWSRVLGHLAVQTGEKWVWLHLTPYTKPILGN